MGRVLGRRSRGRGEWGKEGGGEGKYWPEQCKLVSQSSLSSLLHVSPPSFPLPAPLPQPPHPSPNKEKKQQPKVKEQSHSLRIPRGDSLSYRRRREGGSGTEPRRWCGEGGEGALNCFNGNELKQNLRQIKNALSK